MDCRARNVSMTGTQAQFSKHVTRAMRNCCPCNFKSRGSLSQKPRKSEDLTNCIKIRAPRNTTWNLKLMQRCESKSKDYEPQKKGPSEQGTAQVTSKSASPPKKGFRAIVSGIHWQLGPVPPAHPAEHYSCLPENDGGSAKEQEL